ncbi:MAG: hypothetical protein V7K98_03105 [Nostoc sp.]|uniref:hypothetical protein n=1 Tax=Nostoc sp. TaxID=1180 RepID=UPI002FF85153
MGIGNWELGIGHWALGIGHWSIPSYSALMSVIAYLQRTNDKSECKQKLQVFFKDVTFIYTNYSNKNNSALQLSY